MADCTSILGWIWIARIERYSCSRSKNWITRLNEFEGRIQKHYARNTHRVALQDGVIAARGSPRALAGAVGVKSRRGPQSHSGNRTVGCDWSGGAHCIVVPDAGKISLVGGSRHLIRSRLLGRNEREGEQQFHQHGRDASCNEMQRRSKWRFESSTVNKLSDRAHS